MSTNDLSGAFPDALVHLDRLRMAALDRDLTWVLPPDVLPDVAELYGLPVVHAAVPGPLLAHWLPQRGLVVPPERRYRYGDPAQDPPGSTRWRSPRDSAPWIKVAGNRWVHLGGGGGQEDEDVAGWRPGTLAELADRLGLP